MDAKAGAQEQLTRSRDLVLALSHRIHANPELGFQEEKASTWLSEALANAGFAVRKNVYDLPTAFTATAGSGPLHIAICAEYDSLPSVGHACGHNMIAAMSIGAGIALAKVADDVGLTITVIGTPAEEILDHGGKVLLLERGAFKGMHAAMMVHPMPWDYVEMPIIAVAKFDIQYFGKAAHASGFPHLGVNAADAMTIAQTAIGLLRQQIRPTDRIHGIITKGGDAPNIIPAHTTAEYAVRAQTLPELQDLQAKLLRCFEAGAIATGARLEVSGGKRPDAEMRHDPDMAALYKQNAEALGRVFPDPKSTPPAPVSTDMGNVSHVLPSIHPAIGISSLPAVNHQQEFAAHCVTPVADKAVWDGALSMAWTAIDMASDERVRNRLLRVKS